VYKLNYILLTILFYNIACNNQSGKAFNDTLVDNVNKTNLSWEATLSTVSVANSFGGKELNSIKILQDAYQKNIHLVKNLGMVSGGEAFQKAVLDLYNYSLETCKSYSTIFSETPSKYTKQEWLEWVNNAKDRYNYYYETVQIEQQDYAKTKDYKIQEKTPF
jgi:hypothetical protein